MTRWRTILAALATIAVVSPAVAPAAPAPPPGRIAAVVAPVALYPDALLAPLLMAATYPDEIAEAGAWLGDAQNQKLRGDALVTDLEPRPWDPSVKALVPFPVILDMMAARRDWMEALGAMVVADPAGVIDAVQALRRQAVAAGTLASSPRLTVHDTGGVVTIAPSDPAVVYIPVYNPAVVLGAWAYPDQPPAFIRPPPGFDGGGDIATGIGFSVGYGVLAPLWGWARADWPNHAIAIDTAAYNRINRYGPHVAAGIWHHEPHATGYFHITPAQITPPPALGNVPAAPGAGPDGTARPGGDAKAAARAGDHARTATAASARTGAGAKTASAKTASAKTASAKTASAKTASAKTASAKTASAKTASAKSGTAARTGSSRKAAARLAARRARAPHKTRTAHASEHRRKIRLAAGGAREHHRH